MRQRARRELAPFQVAQHGALLGVSSRLSKFAARRLRASAERRRGVASLLRILLLQLKSRLLSDIPPLRRGRRTSFLLPVARACLLGLRRAQRGSAISF